MRKIMAVLLVLTMILLFAACGDNKNEGTTLDPLYTAYSPVVTSSQHQGSNSAVGATYILTTNQNKTVPALNTTRFSVSNAAPAASQNAASAPSDYNNVSYTTGATVSPPAVSTTRTISTTWATIPTTTTTTTRPITTKTPTTRPTTQPTTKAEPEGINIVINDIFIDSSGRVCAAIDKTGWGSTIDSKAQRVQVYVDGIPMEKPVTLQISSNTTGDGYQYVFLNLDEYGIDTSGSTISFTIPEGFLENKTGTKYNYAYEVSV